MKAATAKRVLSIEVATYFLFLAGIALAFLTAGCSSTQRARFQAHGTNSLVTATGVTVGFFLGGPVGICVGIVGIVGGTMADHALEPEPEVHTQRVIVTAQIPPPLPDGTPQKPVVHSYVDDADTPAPNNLKLPGGIEVPMPKAPEGFLERAWRAAQYAGWLLLGCFVAGWMLTHPKVLKLLWGCVCYAAGAIRRLGAKALAAVAALRAKAPDADSKPAISTNRTTTPKDPANPQ